MLSIFSISALAGEDFEYELSFGNHLELHRSGQEISITARNSSEETISCGDFLLTDPNGDPSGRARVIFLPKNASNGCSFWCSPISSPPPYVVALNIAGPLSPGEEKVCEYEVLIREEFSGTIILGGTNSPIFITRVPAIVPTLNEVGLYSLCLITLLLGISRFRISKRQP